VQMKKLTRSLTGVTVTCCSCVFGCVERQQLGLPAAYDGPPADLPEQMPL
jgi:hypothetical protein